MKASFRLSSSLCLFVALNLGWAATVSARIKLPEASPRQTVSQDLGYGKISIDYSRPMARGRAIFGELVPYGKLWRTGANDPTKVTFSEDAMIAGKRLPAGEYAIVTKPGRDEWQLMFNRDLETLGAYKYDATNNELVISLKPREVSDYVETLEIDIEVKDYETAAISIAWENTAIEFEAMFDTDTRAMQEIETALSAEDVKNWEFYAASTYFLYSGKNTTQAIEWMDRFVSKSKKPPYWALHLRARLLEKAGKSQEAIAAAEMTIKAAESVEDDGFREKYIDWSNKLIARVSKQ